ncbi:hypothetical protein GCM10027290_23930 [Micromonospora sonneratiae]
MRTNAVEVSDTPELCPVLRAGIASVAADWWWPPTYRSGANPPVAHRPGLQFGSRPNPAINRSC